MKFFFWKLQFCFNMCSLIFKKSEAYLVFYYAILPNRSLFHLKKIGGFYALMAAHLASLLLNWDSDNMIFRLRTHKKKPAKETNSNRAQIKKLQKSGQIGKFPNHLISQRQSHSENISISL